MKKRPLGITILAILNIAGGIILFVGQVLMIGFLDELPSLGISSPAAMISVAVLAILALVSGIGMWLGRSWGWWLGAFYYVYGIVRNLNGVISLSGFSDEFGAPSQGIETYYIRFGARVVFYSLILVYLFRGNILEHFGLARYPRSRIAMTLALVAVAVALLWFGISMR